MEKAVTEWPAELLEITPERKEKIRQILESQIEWIEKYLSLSANRNFLHGDKIKFYDFEEFRKIFPFPDIRGESRIMFRSKEIFSLEIEGHERQTLAFLAHELVHAMARHSLFVERSEKDGEHLKILKEFMTGYENVRTKTFFFLNEIVTEMIKIEILDYMRRGKREDLLTGVSIAYHPAVIFFNKVVEKAAEKLNSSAEDLRKRIYTGYFVGDIKALKIFEEAFGKGTLKEFAQLRRNTNFSEWQLYENLCKKLGVDSSEVREEFRKYENNKEIEILGGIKLRRYLLPTATRSK